MAKGMREKRSSETMVSCVMPTYNRRAFVPHAIRYFLRQDYPLKELIIIDDGTDSIADLVPDDPSIRYYSLAGRIPLGAKLNLAWSRITAPVSGRIGLRPVDGGNYISTGTTNGIATITQIAPIDVEFAIPQDRVPEVQERLAQGAKLDATAFDRTRTRRLANGTFATLDNLVDTATGTVKAKARFSNADDALFPNQFVNLRLLLRTVSSAVVVPVTALRHGPNGDYVYVLNDDSTVSQRPVTRQSWQQASRPPDRRARSA